MYSVCCSLLSVNEHAKALIRDGFKCVVTQYFDKDIALRHPEVFTGRFNITWVGKTQSAHIFPVSTEDCNPVDDPGPEVRATINAVAASSVTFVRTVAMVKQCVGDVGSLRLQRHSAGDRRISDLFVEQRRDASV